MLILSLFPPAIVSQTTITNYQSATCHNCYLWGVTYTTVGMLLWCNTGQSPCTRVHVCVLAEEGRVRSSWIYKLQLVARPARRKERKTESALPLPTCLVPQEPRSSIYALVAFLSRNRKPRLLSWAETENRMLCQYGHGIWGGQSLGRKDYGPFTHAINLLYFHEASSCTGNVYKFREVTRSQC